MQQFLTRIAQFAEYNPYFAIFLGICLMLTFWRLIHAIANYESYLTDTVKSLVVTVIMSVLFVIGTVLSLLYAPDLSFTNTGAGVAVILVGMYVFFLIRYSDDSVWIEGVFDPVFDVFI